MKNELNRNGRRMIAAAAAALIGPLGTSITRAATDDSWTNGLGGSWTVASNWALGVAPTTTAYNGIIATAGNYTVTIGSSFSVNSINLNASGAILNDTGGTVNTSTLSLNAGTFQLNGGTMSAAAIAFGGGTFTASNGSLVGANVTGGDINVAASGSVDIQNGLTITGHNLVLGSTSSTLFEGTSTLSALNVAPASNYAYIYVGGANSGSSALLTIAANTFVSGAVIFQDYTGNGTLINNGSIFAPNSTRPLAITVADFINNGTTAIASGGSLLLNSGNITNNGTLSATNSSTLAFGGTFSTASLGTFTADSTSTILFSGTDNNSGSTLKPSGGTWLLKGGTINSGTLDQSTQPLVISVGTLSNVAVTGADLNVPANSTLNVAGTLSVANRNLDVGSTSNVFFDGVNQTLSNLNVNTTASLAVLHVGLSANDTTSKTINVGTLSNITGPFEIFQTANSASDTLNNAGTMNTNTGTLYVETATFNNNGTFAASNLTTGSITTVGNLEVDSLHFVNNGTISLGPTSTLRFVASNFTENGTLTTTGSVAAQNSTLTFSSGTVHNSGTLSLTGTSTVSQPVTSTDTLSGPLIVSPATGDQGTYSIGGGTLSCQQSAIIGQTGSGTFTQTAGSTTITGNFSAGNSGTLTAGTGSGKINISGGSLYADTVLLGSTAGGSGAMTVSGTASVTIGGGLHLNDLTVNGGTVTVLNQAPPAGEASELNKAIVGGYLSNGALNLNGGVVTSPILKLGVTSQMTGTFTETGGAGTFGTVGVGNDGTLASGSGIGVATISGGTLYADTLLLGSTAGGAGMMVVSGTGSVTIGGGAHLNDLTVNGGSVTVLNQAPPAGEDSELNLALVGGYLTNGALLVNGGLVTTPYIKLGVSTGYTGTFAQTAGVVSAGTLCIGDDVTTTSGTGIGTTTISGGSLTVGKLLVGSTAGGNGTLNISGTGNVKVTSALTFVPGHSGFNMSGGTFTLDAASASLASDAVSIGNGQTAATLHLHNTSLTGTTASLTIGAKATLDGGGGDLSTESSGSVLLSGTNLSFSGANSILHIALGGDPTVAANAGVTFDQIKDTGGIFTVGGATLQILPLAGAVLNKPYPIVLASAGGSVNFLQTFSNLTTDPTYTAGTASYGVTYSASEIDVTFTSLVPEPVSATALIGCAVLLRRRKRI